MRVNNKMFLFYTTVFNPLFLNPFISNISNIYNTDEGLSLAPQTICDHMFSDPKSDHTFYVFGYLFGFFSSCMCLLSAYLEDYKVLESTINLSPVESN